LIWRGLTGGSSRDVEPVATSGAAGRRTPGAAPVVTTRVTFDQRSVWTAAWLVIAAISLALFVRFVFRDGGSVFFVALMAFFFAIAVEPLVGRLARYMPRSAATALTFVGLALFLFGFFFAFGSMLASQLSSLVQSAPALLTSLLETINNRFNTNYSTETILADLGINVNDIYSYAGSLAGGLVGIVSNTLGFALNTFAFIFLSYFLSSGLPRLRQWIAGLLKPEAQMVFHTVWQLIVAKVGGYVGARMTLAVINSTTSALFMLVIGMPYWLPLGLWTGLVAQFVPTVGTYIAISLPVIVGATSDRPIHGLWMLLFAIAYQQVENLTIEPRISSRAVNLHPAVSFVSALLGANLFGIAGATLGVPAAATIMALFDIYSRRYEVSAEAEAAAASVVATGRLPAEQTDQPVSGEPASATPGDAEPAPDRPAPPSAT